MDTFTNYLQAQLGAGVSVKVFEHSTLEQRQAIECGTADLIFTDPLLFSCLSAELNLAPLLTARSIGSPSSTYTAFAGASILVRDADTRITSIDDLRGKRVALTAGYAAYLAVDATEAHGDNLLTYAAQVQLISTDALHGALRQLLTERVDAAGVPTRDLQRLLDDPAYAPLLQGKIRILDSVKLPDNDMRTTRSWLPGWVLAAHPNTTDAFKERVLTRESHSYICISANCL